MRRVAFLFVVVALLLSACQPIVIPEGAVDLELGQQAGTVMGDVDFAVPEWGLAEGWIHFEVEQADAQEGTAQGMVRWVEYNDAGELRYVVAEPACLAFGTDGHTAMMAVEIDHKYGWGEGESGQWMQFWINDAGTDGQVMVASPLFPPANENPGCEMTVPEFQFTAIASDVAVRAPDGSAQMDAALTEHGVQPIVERYMEELWNQGDLTVADEIIAESFVSHSHPAGEGLDFLKEIVSGFHADNPNTYFTIDDVIPTDEGFIVMTTMMVRPEGASPDVEGEPVREPMMVMLAMEDDLITDRWAYVAAE